MKPTTMNRLAACGLFLLPALLLGCDGSGPDVQYVEGVVLVDGQPVEGVTVSFSPVNSETGLPAVGTTDATGKFTLTALQGGSPGGGTTAGDYKVGFTKSDVTSISAEEAQQMQDDPNYGKSTGLSAPPKVMSAIPNKYTNPDTSGITVTVKKGENKGEDFQFKLEKS
jgi:hypothetical protein